MHSGLGHLLVLRQGALQSHVSAGDDLVGCDAGMARMETEAKLNRHSHFEIKRRL
jgi:hypothetical protein